MSLEKWKILTLLQNFPENVGNLGKIIVATGSKKCNKLPNLVTLDRRRIQKDNIYHYLMSRFNYQFKVKN